MDLYDYLDKNQSESLENFITFFNSKKCIVNDLVLKLASSSTILEDKLMFLLEEYYRSKQDIAELLNKSICNKRIIEGLIKCIEKKTIDNNVLLNGLIYSIKTNNISSFYFLTSSLFLSTLFEKIKKCCKLYRFNELYCYCLQHLPNYNIKPFITQLLHCDIPITENGLLWLANDKHIDLIAEIFKKHTTILNFETETIEIVFYILLENKEINKEQSKLIIDSISSVDFIPIHIQNHLNYIIIDKDTGIFVYDLYNYYQIESLNKFSMYNIVNNIVKKVYKLVTNLCKYLFTNYLK